MRRKILNTISLIAALSILTMVISCAPREKDETGEKGYIPKDRIVEGQMYADGEFKVPYKPTDYTYMWWVYGLRGFGPDREQLMAIQTGNYAASFDIHNASIKNFGALDNPKIASEAVKQDNDVVLSLPEADNVWFFSDGDKEYFSVERSALDKSKYRDNTRIVESGIFYQRFDMLDIPFETKEKEKPDINARMEVVAMPEYLSLILEILPEEDIENGSMGVSVSLDSSWDNFKEVDDADPGTKVYKLTDESGKGVLVSIPLNEFTENVEVEFLDSQIIINNEYSNWREGHVRHASITLAPYNENTDIKRLSLINPVGPENIVSKSYDSLRPNYNVTVDYDNARGWYVAQLPDIRHRYENEVIERVYFSIENEDDYPRLMPLMFKKQHLPGITGLSPMIRDMDGFPTGLPVQISKNWHDGTWFHGLTLLEIPAGTTVEFEFSMVYARWGHAPAASHAQLSLVGYGGNQLWDQVAVGSHGEQFCYDPDINLNRAMINDVRPLMITSYQSGEKWDWTSNVGGGDFLVYYNESGWRMNLTRMRTYYKNYCPNLTEVTYAGVTMDGKIAAEMTVSTPRTDDVAKAYHRFRYDILEPVEFSRMALYQMGADRYNDHQFDKMAYGNSEGMTEEWEPERGGEEYHRQHIPLEGEVPWVSMHEGVPKQQDWPWANRGMVILSWKAVIDGKEYPIPYLSVFGTSNHRPSANAELSLPSEIEKLSPGDYIECEIEFIVMPQFDEDYYGPNRNLSESLQRDGNTWRPIHRQAVGNNVDITVTEGELTRNYPPVIETNEENYAEFEITGGLAYFPVTFTGVDTYKGVRLDEYKDGEWKAVDQSLFGFDFWQSLYDPNNGSWEITYNIFLDTPGDEPETARFRFKTHERAFLYPFAVLEFPEDEEGLREEVNLALNRIYEGSEPIYSGFTPDRAFNANHFSFWAPVELKDQWISVDFGREIAMNNIVLTEGSFWPEDHGTDPGKASRWLHHFVFRYYDGESWVKIPETLVTQTPRLEKDETDYITHEFELEKIETDRLMLYIYSANGGIYIREIEVYLTEE